MEKTDYIKYGMDAPGVVFIVFLILKLFNLISISWWWVTAPIWIPWIAVLMMLFIYFLKNR